jgi:hypothetical protein
MQAIHIKALMDDIKGGAHPKRNWLKHISGMFLFADSTIRAVDLSDRSRSRMASIAGPMPKSRHIARTGLMDRCRAS